MSGGYYATTPDENGVMVTSHHANPHTWGPALSGQEMMAMVTGWEYERRDWHVQGSQVIRKHLIPRSQLFSPAASGCLVALADLCEARATRAIKANGDTSVLFAANWKHRGEAHRDLHYQWTGQTIFYMREPEIGLPDEELAALAQEYKDELDRAQEEALAESEASSVSQDKTLVALVHEAGFGVVDAGCGRGLQRKLSNDINKSWQPMASRSKTWNTGHTISDMGMDRQMPHIGLYKSLG